MNALTYLLIGYGFGAIVGGLVAAHAVNIHWKQRGWRVWK